MGALQGQRARKGVFITTSTATLKAIAYAGHIATKVVLIDGHQLAGLMIELDVDLVPVPTYVVNRHLGLLQVEMWRSGAPLEERDKS